MVLPDRLRRSGVRGSLYLRSRACCGTFRGRRLRRCAIGCSASGIGWTGHAGILAAKTTNFRSRIAITYSRRTYFDDLGNGVDCAEEPGAILPVDEMFWSSDVTKVVDEIREAEVLRPLDSDENEDGTTEEVWNRAELRDVGVAVPEDKELGKTELERAGDDDTSELFAPPVDDGDKLTPFENDSVNDDELTPAVKDQQRLRTWVECNLRLRRPLPKAILARRGEEGLRGNGTKDRREGRAGQRTRWSLT